MKKTIIITIGVIIVFLAIALFYNTAFMQQIQAMFEPKQETYTELYFDNHLKLPAQIVPNKVYTFSFTVHNLEAKNMQYQYEVYADVNGLKLPIDQNSISVKQKVAKTIAESFTTISTFPKAEIVVNLINKKQQIDFWINK